MLKWTRNAPFSALLTSQPPTPALFGPKSLVCIVNITREKFCLSRLMQCQPLHAPKQIAHSFAGLKELMRHPPSLTIALTTPARLVR